MAGKTKKTNTNKKQGQGKGKSVLEKKPSFIIPQWAIGALIIFTALIYIRALSNGFANLDDDDYILKNPFIRDLSLAGIKAIFSSFYLTNYHPLTTLTYLFEYTLYGLNPLPYHLLNLLLHLVNVWLVYKLIEKLSGKTLVAFIVAVLFALHPMHVESVAWVAERKDVLYTLFYILSLILYLRYLGSGFKTKHYFTTLLLFLFSLLSKSAAVTLPVLLIAIDIYKGRKINMKVLLEKIPFFMLSILFGILALMSQKTALADISVSFTFIDRIFLLTHTIIFYFLKMIIPMGLSAMHYYPDTNGGSLPWQYFASLPLILFIGWLVFRLKSFRKEAIFGIFFFLITISVMLQIVSVGNAIAAERYTYVSYIGLFYIIGQGISGIEKDQVRKVAMILLFVFAFAMSFLTLDRISVWKNGEILTSDVINKNPDYYHCYWLRAIIKRNNNDIQGALADFTKAVELKPNFATGYVDRGYVLNKENDYKGALDDMNRAISLGTKMPEAYNNRGRAYEGLGNHKFALADYNKAIEMNPDLTTAYNNRSVAKASMGDIEGAMKDINKAIKLDPGYAEAYRNRGSIKNLENDYNGAVDDFNYVLKLRPTDSIARFNRGVARLNLKDSAGACEDWKKSLELGYVGASQAIQRICK